MSTILLTGATGFIGQALARELAGRHQVLCLSRSKPKVDLPWIRGDFASFEDLRQLDGRVIDAAIHLAAVTGGCLERDGMLVNVEGTRCLLRYLIDRGCKKFVLASSSAAVGAQSPAFRPLEVPIPDEHPCLDRHGYGFSKYLMEEVTRYYQRQNPDIDVINLRLAAIVPDEKPPAPAGLRPLGNWAACSLALMQRSDAVRVFTLAVESKHRPGVRVLNAAGPRVWASVPTAEILRHWWGSDVDLSYYQQPGHERDSVFDVRRIRDELGFTAAHLPPES
jgi:UDP-glucose 4-epimerase